MVYDILHGRQTGICLPFCHSASLPAWLGWLSASLASLALRAPHRAQGFPKPCTVGADVCHARNDASCGDLDFASRKATARFVTAAGAHRLANGPSRGAPAGYHHRLEGHGPQRGETYGGLEGLPEPIFSLWLMMANETADRQPRQGVHHV